MNNTNNRDQVIEVAARLFFDNGYGRTSMDEVMRVSGVSKSNIYYHFASKDELAYSVAEWWVRKYNHLILSAMSNEAIGLKLRFATVLEMLAGELSKDDRPGGCPFVALYVQCANEDVRRRIAVFFAELAKMLEASILRAQERKEIRADLPASDAAAMFVSALEGALLIAEISGNSEVVRTTGNALIKLL